MGVRTFTLKPQKILENVKKLQDFVKKVEESGFFDGLNNPHPTPSNTPEPLALPDPIHCKETPPECDVNGICTTTKYDCNPEG